MGKLSPLRIPDWRREGMTAHPEWLRGLSPVLSLPQGLALWAVGCGFVFA